MNYTVCEGCPIKDLHDRICQTDDESELFGEVAIGFRGTVDEQLDGVTGVTDERLEEVMEIDIDQWGSDSEEADYFSAHPEIARPVFKCNANIILGTCVQISES